MCVITDPCWDWSKSMLVKGALGFSSIRNEISHFEQLNSVPPTLHDMFNHEGELENDTYVALSSQYYF